MLEQQVEALAKTQTISQILTRHFFRRFFDNDTPLCRRRNRDDGDSRAGFLRCAEPDVCLLVAAGLSGASAARFGRSKGIAISFVLFSFVVMGVVATFEWEMLFPDKADFLILLPMPLKPRELFYAKGMALLAFLGMFLVATNAFSGILFPAERVRAVMGTFSMPLAPIW